MIIFAPIIRMFFGIRKVTVVAILRNGRKHKMKTFIKKDDSSLSELKKLLKEVMSDSKNGQINFSYCNKFSIVKLEDVSSIDIKVSY